MKLILFDIDGTLTYHVGPRRWEDQYAYGLKVAYGLDINEDFGKYNGNVEYQMAWDILRTHGVTQDEFKTHYDRYLHAMYDHLVSWSHKGEVFQAIVDAKKLVQLLKATYPDVVRGVLTGNAKKIATWKLEHAGYNGCFQFGMYGDDATNRIELAKRVFESTKKELSMEFAPEDIIVIGDTIHDIRCGKAIGAKTIGVTTGMHGDANVLRAENPDLVVDSLMDSSVLQLLSENNNR